MLLKTRARRLFALVVPSLALLAAPALDAAPARRHAAARPAAVAAPAPKVDPNAPWLYRGSDIPPDPEWSFGELPNGVRYAVRRNHLPPGQVSIRVRMDVGSLYEKPGEMGYAHLLEHMVFRQSKYLGDGEAIPAWQKMGATFGSDTNAETSPIGTTFKLDLPNSTEASISEAFRLLSGMIAAPTLSEKNVRTDVPIVLAEMRERGGKTERVFDQTQQTLFAGQLLGSRPVIGSEDVLKAATQDSVRAFHSRWYRPENCVIIAVGDIDPAALAADIKQWFGDWQGQGPRTAEPSFGDPRAPAGAKGVAPVGETRAIVEPDLPRSFTYAVLRPWRPVHDTVVYNEGNMVDALAQAIINRRLEARARAGGSYLAAQVNQQKISRSADMTYIQLTPLGPDWRKALGDVRAVIADATIKPPTQAEIDREAQEFSVAFDSSVEQRRLMTGAKLADDMVSALDIRETMASPEVVRDIFNSSRRLFTPANVLVHTRDLFKGTVTRAVYVTPTAGEASDQAVKAALSGAVVSARDARLDARPISFADLPAIGTPAQPVAERPTGVIDITQADYANGVKVMLLPSEDEPGRVTVKVRFGAGWRAFSADTAAYATLGDMALVSAGEGELGQEQIDKLTTGRKMQFQFQTGDSAFTFSAETRAADLADQLYLFADKFARPAWDANPVLRAQAAARLNYESYAASPQGVMERDLKWLERGRDPVFATPDPKAIAATTVDGFRQVWEPILRQGPIEIQIFGDFKHDEALAALNKTFGALPPRGGLPAGTAPATARTMEPLAQPLVVYHRGDTNQSAALIGWPTGGGRGQLRESRQLEILTQLFQNRLLGQLREKLGEAYSPQVVNSWPTDLDSGGNVLVIAHLQPRGVPIFFTTAEQIAADMAARPVSQAELDLVTGPLRQQLNRASSSNAFFMYLLEGATQDPTIYRSLRTLVDDYSSTTPEAMQALARKYFSPGASWRVAIIPQGQTVAALPPGFTGAAPGR